MVTEIEDEVFCNRKFNLVAVANQSGNVNSGHYTCLVKGGKTWWHCNDKAVVRVDLDDMNKSLPMSFFKVDFYGKGGARFRVVLELPCISREEGRLADIKNGG